MLYSVNNHLRGYRFMAFKLSFCSFMFIRLRAGSKSKAPHTTPHPLQRLLVCPARRWRALADGARRTRIALRDSHSSRAACTGQVPS